MIQRFLILLARFVHRFPLPIFFISLLLTILGVYYASSLKIKTNIGDLLPEHTFSVTHLREVMDEIGAAGYLMVMVEGSDTDQMKRFGHALTDELLKVKQQRKQEGKEIFVQAVDLRNDIQYFKDRALYFLSQDELMDIWERIDDRVRKEKLKANPLFVNLDDEEDEKEDDSAEVFSLRSLHQKYRTGDFKEYFIADDNSVLGVLVRPTQPSSDLGFNKRLLEHVRAVGDRVIKNGEFGDTSFDLGGSYRNKSVEKQSIIDDLVRSLSTTMILLVLVLTLYFRRLRSVVVIMTPLVMGVVWALAVAEFKYGHLNMITAFIFAVLLGLGIDFGIHFLNRYMECRHKGMNTLDSLIEAEGNTGRAIFTGAMTTSAAFFSLTLADFRGFSQFGFIAGMGLVFCVIASFLVHPAMLLLSEKMVPIVKKDGPTKDIKPVSMLHPGLIVLVTLLIVAYGGWAVAQSFKCHSDAPWYSDTARCGPDSKDCCEPPIDFEYNFAKLRTRNNPVLNMSKKYGKAMPLSLQPVMVVAEDLEDTRLLHERVMEMRDTTERSTLKVTRSLYTFLSGDMNAKQSIIKQIRKLLNNDNLELIKDPQTKADAQELLRMTLSKPMTLFGLPEKIIRTFSIVRPGKEEIIPFLKDVMKDWQGRTLDDRFVQELSRRWKDLSEEKREQVNAWVADVEIPKGSPLANIDDVTLARLIRWTQHRVGVLNMIYTNVDTWNGIACIRFNQEASVIKAGDRTYHPVGEAFVFADTMWAMEKDGVKAISASILVVFLLLLFDFRSLKHTLLVMVPLFTGILGMCAFMALTGVKISFFNMVVLPTIVGIGVDNGVHIYHRYLEEGPGSIPRVLGSSGWAVTLSSITTMIGFAGMNTANHAGLNSIGELAIIGMTACLLASTLSFPALLTLLDKRRERKERN